MSKRINVGVIGVGGIGAGAHLSAYQRISDVEIMALCDRSEKRLQEVARQYDVKTPILTIEKCWNYRALMRLEHCQE